MRGESMKDKSKKSTYSTTFGVDPVLTQDSPLTIALADSGKKNERLQSTRPNLF